MQFRNRRNSTFLFSILQRSIFLYVLVGLILFFCIDYHSLKMMRLDYLRPDMDYLGRFHSAEVALDEQKLKDAILYYDELKKFPSPIFKAFASGNLGFCHFYLQDYSKAISLYKEAIKYHPVWYGFYYDMGMISLIGNDYKNAANFLEDSLAWLSRTDAYMERISSELKNNNGDFLAVFSVSRILQDTHRDGPEIYLHLGRCYFVEKNYQRMRDYSLEGIQRYPDNPRLYFNAGLAYLFLKDYQTARGYFDKAVRIERPVINGFYFRGLCQQNLGAENEAQEDMLKFFTLSKGQKVPADLFGNIGRLHFYSDEWFFRICEFMKFWRI